MVSDLADGHQLGRGYTMGTLALLQRDIGHWTKLWQIEPYQWARRRKCST